jgi:pyruvate dehydrogenase E2 component (dihydrolipoamide acetyltransferase)
MPTDVIMPMLGMNQDTGKVVRWLRAEGDDVAKGDPLLEVETDKVTVEIEAPAAGTLSTIVAVDGAEVPVGQAIAVILAAGESPSANDLAAVRVAASAAAPAAGETTAGASNGAGVREVRDNLSQGTAAAAGVAVAETPERARRPLASPKARRLAEARGLPIAEVAGSGPNGAVVAADVERHATSGLVPRLPPVTSEPDTFEVGSVWRVMAERTQRAWQEVPHFFLTREVDATRLDGWRESVRKRAGAEKVTHTDLLVRLVAAALREHPRVNATWRDGTIVANPQVNVGIAVAAEDGLVVPVVHDADRLELPQIAARRGEIVAAARERRLKPQDVSGGTFTISNLGMFGVDAFMAIVNAPQAAILSVGRIAQRAVVVEGNVVARPTLVLGLSFDHRVVDGAAGARFLDTLASLVEEPAGLVR